MKYRVESSQCNVFVCILSSIAILLTSNMFGKCQFLLCFDAWLFVNRILLFTFKWSTMHCTFALERILMHLKSTDGRARPTDYDVMFSSMAEMVTLKYWNITITHIFGWCKQKKMRCYCALVINLPYRINSLSINHWHSSDMQILCYPTHMIERCDYHWYTCNCTNTYIILTDWFLKVYLSTVHNIYKQRTTLH